MTTLEPPTIGFYGSPAVAWFIGLGRNEVIERLDPAHRPIILGLAANLNRLIDSLLDTDEPEEFRRRREAATPQLFSLLASLGYLVLADLPQLSELLAPAFDQAEAMFDSSALLSNPEKEEIAFALMTMRQNVRMLMQIVPGGEALSPAETGHLESALLDNVLAFLDLVLLIACVRREGPHFVVIETLQGCKAALRAYASLRQFFELHCGESVGVASKVPMDDEDRALALSSHRERESTLKGW
jgi:hypothetical protein